MWQILGWIFYALAFLCLGILLAIMITLYIDVKLDQKDLEAYDKLEFKKEDKDENE